MKEHHQYKLSVLIQIVFIVRTKYNPRKLFIFFSFVYYLQDLKPDRISKYAIGHTTSFSEVCKEVKVFCWSECIVLRTIFMILSECFIHNEDVCCLLDKCFIQIMLVYKFNF